MELRASFLTAGSFMLSGLVIANSFYQKKQFYPSVVHLTRSNPCMAVIYLQALVFVILLGKVTRRIFFGQLRPSELEHLIERSWYALTETCLAFTVFRDDFSPRFVALFTLLLFMKCFHWLAEDRVDYMERSPVITLLFHIRMMGLVAILSAFDSYFVSHAYFSTVLRGASVQLVFGFEYAILLTSVFMISVKYILHTVDLRNAHPWENKAVYLLYSELFLVLVLRIDIPTHRVFCFDFVRVILYSVFMIVMMKLHTFPLFSVRPMYLTIRSFRKALNDVILSRRAISYMDTLYPNVASEELRSGDNVCIICREEMISGAKKLPCNHIFHTSCLRSWFQRQQTCPTCRLDILQMPVASARAAQNHRNNNVNYSPRPDQQTPSATAPTAQPSAAEADQRGAASNQSSYGHVPAFSQLPSFAPFNNHSHAAPGLPTVPPFIPPLPFMIPFPSTPDFSALTDEEVRNLEGVERRAVEARIQCLRNVGTLLDAATVQLQQYLSVLSVLGANMNALPVSLHDGASSVLVGSNNGVALSTDTAQTSAAVSEEQEIRRRRLEHFQAKTSGNTLGV